METELAVLAYLARWSISWTSYYANNQDSPRPKDNRPFTRDHRLPLRFYYLLSVEPQRRYRPIKDPS